MKNKLISYLKKHKITEPYEVDRLLISTFIIMNKIRVKRNDFILNHLINGNNILENKLLDELLNIVQDEFEIFGFEELIRLFEFVISPSDKVINGAVYTPSYIREYITHSSFNSLAKKQEVTVSDISCGCGGFLFTASVFIKKITGRSFFDIFQNDIYGVDIQEFSVNRTKILLILLALSHGEDRKEFKLNIYTGDSLLFDWGNYIESFSGFDIILGNPPYVCSRNLTIVTKSLIKNWSVCSTGNTDLYIPFFQIGLDNLSSTGVLGYITMNSFFKSLNGRALREYFHKNNIFIQIIDFGPEQVFSSKNTYTCICFLRKEQLGYIEYVNLKSESLTKTDKDIAFETVAYDTLNHRKGWNLQESKTMTKIESTGKPFGSIYKIRHGIATLKNNVYIFKPIKHDDEFYYLRSDDGEVYKIERALCRDVINSNKLSSNYTLNDLTEKLIFPYTKENSPNLIIESVLKNNYPHAYTYLLGKKHLLDMRDKGNNKDYPCWYAYGRTQSLQGAEYKLFLPKMSKTSPYSIISEDKDLMFYNGIAVIGCSLYELLFIQKIIRSRLFWYYITKTSKPYSSEYFSLTGNYINNFGVYQFSVDEMNYIISENNKEKLDEFIESKYDIKIPKLFLNR
ncbi:TPA: HsdM family class I SAM-dependent methyltransferase [Serratia marcescens]|uniref:Eco57I restriction-modification methylase domain-containing protein n=1 Tax=Serratia marcescens TaxID=615 RepID=UPI0009A4F85A|nr:N-6 DNA methylase [Serratia marcescens]MBN5291145.1 N-6 DNA methylase [Serratia marcescens]OPJ99257.1 N-6 DNA methylase [Serratia marcescens]HEJ8031171.1 N-6 DNA methylase [Serratia marcescens]